MFYVVRECVREIRTPSIQSEPNILMPKRGLSPDTRGGQTLKHTHKHTQDADARNKTSGKVILAGRGLMCGLVRLPCRMPCVACVKSDGYNDFIVRITDALRITIRQHHQHERQFRRHIKWCVRYVCVFSDL